MPGEDARSIPRTDTVGRFLDGVLLRQVSLAGGLFSSVGLALGQGTSPLEVLVASGAAAPNATALRSLWKARNTGRAAPLLLVVLHGERASLCGPAGDDPPAYLSLDRGQVERICREALDQSDRHAALRALRDVLPSLESDLAGLRNIFETFHEGRDYEDRLRTTLKYFHDWKRRKD